jgi:hypothetical protein
LLQQRILDFDLWEAEAAVRSPSHSEGQKNQNSIFDRKMMDAEGIELEPLCGRPSPQAKS